MAVVHGEQCLQPGDSRLHSMTRTAFRGENLLKDGGGGAAPWLRSQKENKKDFVGSGSDILRGRSEWLLGKALPAPVLAAPVDPCDGVLPAQSSRHSLVGGLGKGKRASPPFLPQDWVGNTNIISQRTFGIFCLALE